MARIHFLDDNNEPQVVEITAETGDVLVGRASDCAIRTAGHSVSRKHARIGWQDGLFVLEDLGSSNGTFYFTERLEPNLPVILEDGVLFRCGAFELRFERDAQDLTLEQEVPYPVEGGAPMPFDIPSPPSGMPQIPPPPSNIPPPPMNVPPPPSGMAPAEIPPPPPFDIPPPPEELDGPQPQAKPPSIGVANHPLSRAQTGWSAHPPIGPDEFGATTDSHLTLEGLSREVKILVTHPEPRPDLVMDELPPAPPEAKKTKSKAPPEIQPEPDPVPEPVPEPEPAAEPAVETADHAAELQAAREEADARTALWRQALADLSDAHEETAAATARAEAAELERDRLKAEFAAADAARRQLAAKLALMESQHAAGEQALLEELAAARAGKPSPKENRELLQLRADLAAAQASLRDLDEQSVSEAAELRRQLTECQAENERLSGQL